MSDTIDLDEARAMFSQPEAKQTTPKQRRPQRRDSAAAEAIAVKAAAEDYVGKDRMAVMMAEKRHQKYAVVGKNGDDVILLFGKHKGSKISLLASTVDGRDYLRWMLGQEFAPELLKAVRTWLARQI